MQLSKLSSVINYMSTPWVDYLWIINYIVTPLSEAIRAVNRMNEQRTSYDAENNRSSVQQIHV